jgi:hypothetical protein
MERLEPITMGASAGGLSDDDKFFHFSRINHQYCKEKVGEVLSGVEFPHSLMK